MMKKLLLGVALSVVLISQSVSQSFAAAPTDFCPGRFRKIGENWTITQNDWSADRTGVFYGGNCSKKINYRREYIYLYSREASDSGPITTCTLGWQKTKKFMISDFKNLNGVIIRLRTRNLKPTENDTDGDGFINDNDSDPDQPNWDKVSYTLPCS